MRGLLHHRHDHFEVAHHPPHYCRLHLGRVNCLNFISRRECVVQHSCGPVIVFTRIAIYVCLAHVIIGFGLGPAFCPLPDSGKGVLGGASLRLSGGEQIARSFFLLLFHSGLRPTSDQTAGVRVQSVQWTLRFSADLDPPFTRGV